MHSRFVPIKWILAPLLCWPGAASLQAGRVLALVDRPDVQAFAFPLPTTGAGVLVALDEPARPRTLWLVNAEGQPDSIPVEVQSPVLAVPSFLNANDPAWAGNVWHIDQPQCLFDGKRIYTLKDWPIAAAGVPVLNETFARVLGTVKVMGACRAQKIVFTPEGAVILGQPQLALKNMLSVELWRKTGSSWQHATIDYLPSGLAARLVEERGLRDCVTIAGTAQHFQAFDPVTQSYVFNGSIVRLSQVSQPVLSINKIRAGIQAANLPPAAIDHPAPPSSDADLRLAMAFQLEVYEWDDVLGSAEPTGIAATFQELGLNQPPFAYRLAP